MEWIIIAVLSLIGVLFYKDSLSKAKDREIEVAKAERRNTEELITLFRMQSHDHINHIQTLTSMLVLDEKEIALEYLKGISKNYRVSKSFLRLGNTTLTALVNTKMELAIRANIEFVVIKYCRVELSKVYPWDLSSMIGNLFDNAHDYVSANDVPKKIYFKLEYGTDIKKCSITVGNPYLKDNVPLDRFFVKGYSSKQGHSRGLGLSIVKDLVDKYDGTIKVYVEDDILYFNIILED